MKDTQNLSNSVYGYLTLKKQESRKDSKNQYRKYWWCECKCGKNKFIREESILSGRTRSCGCLVKELQKRNSDHPGWKGIGTIPGQYFAVIICKCRRLGIDFQITKEKAWEVYQSQNGLCNLTGIPITFSTLKAQKRGIEQTASLDRIDSSKGYTNDNIQWIHKDVNLMKNKFSQEYFLKICNMISQKSPRLV